MKHTIIGLLSLAFAGLFGGEVSADIKVPTSLTCNTTEIVERGLKAKGQSLDLIEQMEDGDFVEIWKGRNAYTVVARSVKYGFSCLAALGMLEGEGV